MAQVYLFKNVVKEILDSRAKGELGGRAIPLSLANGNIDIQVNHELPPEVAKKLEEVKADIASGKLKIELK